MYIKLFSGSFWQFLTVYINRNINVIVRTIVGNQNAVYGPVAEQNVDRVA